MEDTLDYLQYAREAYDELISERAHWQWSLTRTMPTIPEEVRARARAGWKARIAEIDKLLVDHPGRNRFWAD